MVSSGLSYRFDLSGDTGNDYYYVPERPSKPQWASAAAAVGPGAVRGAWGGWVCQNRDGPLRWVQGPSAESPSKLIK